MDINEEFKKAAEKVKKLKTKPSDKVLLKIYGLYKQSTVGLNKTIEPSFWDLKNKAKWEAWKSEEKLNSDEAKKKYIYLVNKLVENEK